MKILVVDDHVLIREALRGVLKELAAEVAILEATNAGAALQALEQHGDITLVLLDLGLPDRDGFSLLEELNESHPAISVVVLSALQERADVAKALDLGASGFIPKSADREVMLGALRLVLCGGIYIPPQILAREEPSTRPARISPVDLGLTERQVAVLALMAQGKSNKVICRTLNIAEATVKNHVTAILKALRVTNRSEAVVAVGKLGWDLTVADQSEL
jgi:DNA-binding NarL/FixJ family response regulator